MIIASYIILCKEIKSMRVLAILIINFSMEIVLFKNNIMIYMNLILILINTSETNDLIATVEPVKYGHLGAYHKCPDQKSVLIIKVF